MHLKGYDLENSKNMLLRHFDDSRQTQLFKKVKTPKSLHAD